MNCSVRFYVRSLFEIEKIRERKKKIRNLSSILSRCIIILLISKFLSFVLLARSSTNVLNFVRFLMNTKQKEFKIWYECHRFKTKICMQKLNVFRIRQKRTTRMKFFENFVSVNHITVPFQLRSTSYTFPHSHVRRKLWKVSEEKRFDIKMNDDSIRIV